MLPDNAAEKLNQVLRGMQIELQPVQIEKLLSYYNMLTERNKVMNLTAITEFEEVIRKHFADSLAPLSCPETCEMFRKNGIMLLDLGTGAGFPGLPLAIAMPEAEITLADSLQKRTHFLQETADELGLTNVRVVSGRAEDLGKDPEYREHNDVVVSRAVADLRVLCEYCLPFVKPGGCFAAWKGPGAEKEAEEAGSAIKTLGGKEKGVVPYALPDAEEKRNLVIIEKTGITPEKYPRRAGIPSKRPL